MKKTAENRYPHSATLFRFCKEALEIRYEGNVKVIDQDVGAILGYDPADCSHWKKGKKNIRALATLRSIADHLSIDERLLIDIAGGKVGLEEAVFEFRGYGAFALQGRHLENLKLVQDDTIATVVEATVQGEGTAAITTVKYRGAEMRPYVRFLLAKEL